MVGPDGVPGAATSNEIPHRLVPTCRDKSSVQKYQHDKNVRGREDGNKRNKSNYKIEFT